MAGDVNLPNTLMFLQTITVISTTGYESLGYITGDAGAVQVAESVSKLTNLKRLDLSCLLLITNIPKLFTKNYLPN